MRRLKEQTGQLAKEKEEFAKALNHCQNSFVWRALKPRRFVFHKGKRVKHAWEVWIEMRPSNMEETQRKADGKGVSGIVFFCQMRLEESRKIHSFRKYPH